MADLHSCKVYYLVQSQTLVKEYDTILITLSPDVLSSPLPPRVLIPLML